MFKTTDTNTLKQDKKCQPCWYIVLSTMFGSTTTSEGSLHHDQRQLLQPAFHQDRLRIYAATMTEHILRMCNRWEDNDTIDVHKEFMQLTLAIVCKALFSFDIESETKEIGKHVTTLVEYFNRARMPLVHVIEKFINHAHYLFTIR